LHLKKTAQRTGCAAANPQSCALFKKKSCKSRRKLWEQKQFSHFIVLKGGECRFFYSGAKIGRYSAPPQANSTKAPAIPDEKRIFHDDLVFSAAPAA
jgi:hypothetical protein